MKETDIRRYAELMKELDLTGLEITDDETKVRLERSVLAPEKDAAYSAPDAADMAANPESEDYISVKSNIVGVFYTAPAENAAPYVSVGEPVTKGQTLCIVEAMKLMNEIVADEDGVVLAVCADNGQIVEYGTELFRIGKR